jgi:hypothetical protein
MEEALLAPAESARFARPALAAAATASISVQAAIVDFTRVFRSFWSKFKTVSEAHDLPRLFGPGMLDWG